MQLLSLTRARTRLKQVRLSSRVQNRPYSSLKNKLEGDFSPSSTGMQFTRHQCQSEESASFTEHWSARPGPHLWPQLVQDVLLNRSPPGSGAEPFSGSSPSRAHRPPAPPSPQSPPIQHTGASGGCQQSQAPSSPPKPCPSQPFKENRAKQGRTPGRQSGFLDFTSASAHTCFEVTRGGGGTDDQLPCCLPRPCPPSASSRCSLRAHSGYTVEGPPESAG